MIPVCHCVFKQGKPLSFFVSSPVPTEETDLPPQFDISWDVSESAVCGLFQPPILNQRKHKASLLLGTGTL